MYCIQFDSPLGLNDASINVGSRERTSAKEVIVEEVGVVAIVSMR